MSNESYVALVAPQKWKLRLCGVAMAAVSTCYVAASLLADWFGINRTLLTLGATAGFLSVLIGACQSIKCPSCGLSLVWHGVSKKSASNCLVWLLDVRTCPRCGHQQQVHE